MLVFIVVLNPLPFPKLYAQETADTLSSKETNRVDKALSSMTLRVQFGTELNADYKLKPRDGNVYEKGTIRDAAKVRMALNIPVLRAKFATLSVSPYYANYHLKFSREEMLPESPVMDMNGTHHTWGISMNGNFQTKLFGKQVLGNANMVMEGSEYGIEWFSGMIIAVMQVKQTRLTSIGIGVLGLIHTSSSIPVFPVFTFRQKFSDKWALDLMMPRVHLKYTFNEKNRLSVGMSIDGDHFYVHPEKESLSKVYRYSKSVMTPEFVYERTVGKQFRLTVRSGISVSMASRIYNPDNYKEYISVSQPTGGFINIGFAYSMSKK
ncbi:MAG: DUF6268 family outer membrane beta-barrel protein [Prevotellaceae bacterium]|nr:DUF6268 family outer membrane beta-barrel protein [Prevotellaceae bacterium]